MTLNDLESKVLRQCIWPSTPSLMEVKNYTIGVSTDTLSIGGDFPLELLDFVLVRVDHDKKIIYLIT